MRLKCPKCDTGYEIDLNVLPEGGRVIKCWKCGHDWLQTRPAPLPTAQTAPPTPAPVTPPVTPPATTPSTGPATATGIDTAPKPRRLAPELARLLKEEANREQRARRDARAGPSTQAGTQAGTEAGTAVASSKPADPEPVLHWPLHANPPRGAAPAEVTPEAPASAPPAALLGPKVKSRRQHRPPASPGSVAAFGGDSSAATLPPGDQLPAAHPAPGPAPGRAHSLAPQRAVPETPARQEATRQAPARQEPARQEPARQPPAIQPPAIQPPAVQPPAVQPSAAQPAPGDSVRRPGPTDRDIAAEAVIQHDLEEDFLSDWGDSTLRGSDAPPPAPANATPAPLTDPAAVGAPEAPGPEAPEKTAAPQSEPPQQASEPVTSEQSADVEDAEFIVSAPPASSRDADKPGPGPVACVSADVHPAPPAPPRSRGFGAGLLTAVVFFALAALTYVYAAQIRESYPGSAPALQSYVLKVDEIRARVSGLADQAVAQLTALTTSGD